MLTEFSNVNLQNLLQSPEVIGEMCYHYRKMISPDGYLPPKSLFANMLKCEVIDLARIESGYSTDFPLALRYLLKLEQTYNLFNKS